MADITQILKIRTLDLELEATREEVRIARAERDALRDKIVCLIQWMTEQGLLHYHDHCKRPDGSSGPAWIVCRPSIIAGDSCEAWHETAAGAVDAWLLGPDLPSGA
jgi:hypothetical protein